METLADSTLPYVSKKSRSLRSLVSWLRLPTNMVPTLSSRALASRSTLRPPLDRGDGLGDADIELWLCARGGERPLVSDLPRLPSTV